MLALINTNGACSQAHCKVVNKSSSCGTRIRIPARRNPLALTSSPIKTGAVMSVGNDSGFSGNAIQDQNRNDQTVNRDTFSKSDKDQGTADQFGFLCQGANGGAANGCNGDARAQR